MITSTPQEIKLILPCPLRDNLFAFPKFIERLAPNSSLMSLWAEFGNKTKGDVPYSAPQFYCR